MVMLKQKKQFESQLNSIQEKKLNLETQIMALEDATLSTETVNAMSSSAMRMKASMKESDIDKADELMEDINEAMDMKNEMMESMSMPLGSVMDDDELENELAELEELECDEVLTDLAGMPAPSAKPMMAAAMNRNECESDSDASQNYYERSEDLDEEDVLALMMM